MLISQPISDNYSIENTFLNFCFMNPRHIQHLYWRAGFGLSPTAWQERKNWRIQQAINQLFKQSSQSSVKLPNERPVRTSDQMSAAARNELRKAERQKVADINFEWLLRMGSPSHPALLERMCLFWHDHFACESKFSFLATQQLNVIRTHALGSFRDLVHAIAKDPAMIRYLNNQQNRKQRPNENFARELMELFTMGRGNYSEQDVKAAARAFTGWSSDRQGNFVFRSRLHDYGPKVFLGKSGQFDGDEIIDIILEQPATATFICRKIYQYFVNEEVDESRVRQLADRFYSSGYDIGRLMRHIFSSDWFYADKNIGTKIKSPVELLAGCIRQLGLSNITPASIMGLQKAMGQILFKPPNVAGWPGGKNWIDNSTLLLRLNLPAAIFRANQLNFELAPALEQERRTSLRRMEVNIDLAPISAMASRQSETEQIATLSSYFLVSESPLDLSPMPSRIHPEQKFKAQIIRLMTLPAYQLC